jgi:dTDP-glucose pyrophosphorylase
VKAAELALGGIGHHGEHDDDPVTSCLDALADDMRILEVALQAEPSERGDVDAESAIGRFIERVKAIRALHVERSDKGQTPARTRLADILEEIDERTNAAHDLCTESWQTKLCAGISEAVVEARTVVRKREAGKEASS